MRAALLIPLLSVLGACAEPESGQTQGGLISDSPASSLPPDTATPASAAPEVSSLEGGQRVAGVDGEDFHEPYGLALYGNATSLWWEPRCARQELRYRIEGQRFRATPIPENAPAPSRADPGEPPARSACAIGLPPRLEEVLDIVEAAARVERTPENGVLISGDERSVLLFSQ